MKEIQDGDEGDKDESRSDLDAIRVRVATLEAEIEKLHANLNAMVDDPLVPKEAAEQESELTSLGERKRAIEKSGVTGRVVATGSLTIELKSSK